VLAHDNRQMRLRRRGTHSCRLTAGGRFRPFKRNLPYLPVRCESSLPLYPSSYLSWRPGFWRTMTDGGERRHPCEQRLSVGFTMAASPSSVGGSSFLATVQRCNPAAPSAQRRLLHLVRSAPGHQWRGASRAPAHAARRAGGRIRVRGSGQVPANLSTLKCGLGQSWRPGSDNVPLSEAVRRTYTRIEFYRA
jgi:hypothetical protein